MNGYSMICHKRKGRLLHYCCHIFWSFHPKNLTLKVDTLPLISSRHKHSLLLQKNKKHLVCHQSSDQRIFFSIVSLFSLYRFTTAQKPQLQREHIPSSCNMGPLTRLIKKGLVALICIIPIIHKRSLFLLSEMKKQVTLLLFFVFFFSICLLATRHVLLSVQQSLLFRLSPQPISPFALRTKLVEHHPSMFTKPRDDKSSMKMTA